jgi:hypothetical protein
LFLAPPKGTRSTAQLLKNIAVQKQIGKGMGLQFPIQQDAVCFPIYSNPHVGEAEAEGP